MLETPGNLNEKTIDRLNDLIRLNIDSAEGFAEAADVVSDPEVRARFREYSNQRSAQADELKKYVRYNEEQPRDSGSTLGAMHRWWIDLRAKFSGGEPGPILSEAERGEDVIKDKYEDVLKETAGSAVNDVIQRQYVNVKRGHDEVRSMRDRFTRHGR